MSSRKKKRDKDWYARASGGLKDLRAKTEAERELMEALEHAAPEIQRLLMLDLLAKGALPAPTHTTSSESRH